VQVIEILILGIVFMALFSSVGSLFTNPVWYVSTQGNNATFTNTTGIGYDATTAIILKIVPILIVIGVLYYVWSSSQKGKTGGLKI